MRPGIDARLRRAPGAVPPGTDPVSLLITTVAVLVGLVATGLTAAPARPAQPARPSRAGTPARSGSPGYPVTPAAGPAMQLLSQAAAASEAVSYRGVEMLVWWGPGGTTASEADIWHRAGQEPALRAAAQAQVWPAGTLQPARPGPAVRNLAAVLGLSPRLVSLLGRNYQVTTGGRGQVAGRPALLVNVRRPGGALAARFWLDRVTKLPLRRRIFGPGGSLLSEDAFLSISLGGTAGTAGPAREAGVWRDALGAGQLARLRARGWPLPGPLPGQLALLDAREGSWPSGPVVHLAYSDGLSMVSVFIQRGLLPPRPAGWSPAALHGHQIYVDDDGTVAWSARGFVFTVIAQAPAGTVSAVVAALPHPAPPRPPGLLARLRLGAHRLLSWLGVPR